MEVGAHLDLEQVEVRPLGPVDRQVAEIPDGIVHHHAGQALVNLGKLDGDLLFGVAGLLAVLLAGRQQQDADDEDHREAQQQRQATPQAAVVLRNDADR